MSHPQQRIRKDSLQWYRLHQDTLLRKAQKLQTLQALLDMWENLPDQADPHYLRKLRARLRSTQHQFDAMKP
jgi:hypothetical protein